MDGAIVVNKPEGWTSHDVVAKMRGIAGTKSIGHLGTLDPIATGVLPLLVGRATKLAQYFDRSDKVYEAVVRFGFATTTYDREGEKVGPESNVTLDSAALEEKLAAFRGEILQTPPPVSAKKIKGVPAYKLARKGQPVELAPVRVTVHELTLTRLEGDRAWLTVHCSAGTYIRSIAHDLGQALGYGAHIDQLTRTRSGEFTIEHARTLEHLQEMKGAGRLNDALVAMSTLLPKFPNVYLDDVTTIQVKQGRDFSVSPFRVTPGSEYVKALGPAGDIVAIGKIVLPNLYHPAVVWN